MQWNARPSLNNVLNEPSVYEELKMHEHALHCKQSK